LAWAHTCWLHHRWEDLEADVPEPPVPARLNKLNGALNFFVELLDMDPDLLSLVTKARRQKKRKPEVKIEAMISRLSDQEKDDFLVRVTKDEPLLSVKLNQRLQKLVKTPKSARMQESTRTIGTMLQEAEQIKQRRKEAEGKKREAKKLQRLKKLEAEESTLWDQVDLHISEKNVKAYDAAIDILKKLHTLAKHKNTEAEFELKIRHLMQRYSRLSSLKSKLDWAKLIP